MLNWELLGRLGASSGSDGTESACNAGHWAWSLGQESPLKRGMATHFSIVAWRIPWSEKPGGLQTMGSQRVGQDWAANTFTFWKTRLCWPWQHWHLGLGHSLLWKGYPMYRRMFSSIPGLHPWDDSNTFPPPVGSTKNVSRLPSVPWGSIIATHREPLI